MLTLVLLRTMHVDVRILVNVFLCCTATELTVKLSYSLSGNAPSTKGTLFSIKKTACNYSHTSVTLVRLLKTVNVDVGIEVYISINCTSREPKVNLSYSMIKYACGIEVMSCFP